MLTASIPAARNASSAFGEVRKWYVFGSGVPREVIAVSRLTIVRSPPARVGVIGPKAVAGSLSRVAVRSMKCTSPAKTRLRSTGAGDGDGDVEGGAAAAE